MSRADDVSEFVCPYCEVKPVEVGTKMYFVRGYGVAHQTGYRVLLGSASCVASELRKEAGRNLLYGWFSPMALVISLGLIPWNFFRSFALKPDRASVDRALLQLGVPDARALERLDDVIYALAAGMVRADGRVDEAELAAIEQVGPRIVPDFDMRRFTQKLERTGSQIPVENLVNSVAPFLDDAGKATVLRALVYVAYADGDCDAAEEKLLQRVRRSLRVDKASLRAMKAEIGRG